MKGGLFVVPPAPDPAVIQEQKLRTLVERASLVNDHLEAAEQGLTDLERAVVDLPAEFDKMALGQLATNWTQSTLDSLVDRLHRLRMQA